MLGRTIRTLTLITAVMLGLRIESTAAQEQEALAPPEVGQVAPALGSVLWRHLPDGKPPKIEDLRGEVVVVQTWVWFCDS